MMLVPGSNDGSRPGLVRTSSNGSKSNLRQRRQSSVILYVAIGVPLFFGLMVLYSTRFLMSHDGSTSTSSEGKLSVNANADENDDPSINDTDSDNNNEDVSIKSGDFEYHIVFSTGCTLYQDWQSYVFFHHTMISKQPGTITRIVSGCENQQAEDEIKEIFNQQIASMNERFKIHITPDYSKLENGKSFVYCNKPFGMKHWLENALGFPNNPINKDAIVILLDPDQLIMRPFTNNDFSNTNWKFIEKDITPYTSIEHGKPMGQLYGFGLQWKDKVDINKIIQNSPIEKLSRKEAQAGYIVGPPYVATAQDMYTIVSQWCEFARPVHDQYPYLLAEMFAYCLGAAHVQLPHQTAASFMISDTSAGNMEGWSYIDKMPDDEICSNTYTIDELPNVLHFCQRYGMGKYFFGKRKLPKDFISCESPLLTEPPTDILTTYDFAVFPGGNKKSWNKQMAKRNAFTLCYIIPALNAAATYYKKNHCTDENANYKKDLIFFDTLDTNTFS